MQIVSFGYTPDQSLLYGTPGGAVEVVALVVSGYLGDRYKNRILISMVGLTTALVGMILIVAAVRRTAELDFFERSRIHEENYYRGIVPDRLLRWEHHRCSSFLFCGSSS